MTTEPKDKKPGLDEQFLPSGISLKALARALFFEDVMSEKLSTDARQARWKENYKAYFAKSRRLAKRLSSMDSKSDPEAI